MHAKPFRAYKMSNWILPCSCKRRATFIFWRDACTFTKTNIFFCFGNVSERGFYFRQTQKIMTMNHDIFECHFVNQVFRQNNPSSNSMAFGFVRRVKVALCCFLSRIPKNRWINQKCGRQMWEKEATTKKKTRDRGAWKRKITLNRINAFQAQMNNIEHNELTITH